MTAERFLERITEDKGDDMENIYHAMIEFAKYHVQKALEVASKEADLYDIDSASNIGNQYYGDEVTIIVGKESILNSYPLENIK